MKAAVPILVGAVLVLSGLVYVVGTSNPPANFPACPVPAGAWFLGLGAQMTTDDNHTSGTDMKTYSVRNGNVSGLSYRVCGGVTLSKNLRLDPTRKSVLFSWYVSPKPFPDPLVNYSSKPANATQVASYEMDTWQSSILGFVNASTPSVSMEPGWYAVAVIDASGGVHAETQASLIIVPTLLQR